MRLHYWLWILQIDNVNSYIGYQYSDVYTELAEESPGSRLGSNSLSTLMVRCVLIHSPLYRIMIPWTVYRTCASGPSKEHGTPSGTLYWNGNMWRPRWSTSLPSHRLCSLTESIHCLESQATDKFLKIYIKRNVFWRSWSPFLLEQVKDYRVTSSINTKIEV